MQVAQVVASVVHVAHGDVQGLHTLKSGLAVLSTFPYVPLGHVSTQFPVALFRNFGSLQFVQSSCFGPVQ